MLSLVVSLTAPFQEAQSLVIKSTTAQPNQAAGVGKNVIGGKPTRISWEASLEVGDEIQSITLIFPAGMSLNDNTNVVVTVLDGKNRLTVDYDTTITAEQLVVVFAEAIIAPDVEPESALEPDAATADELAATADELAALADATPVDMLAAAAEATAADLLADQAVVDQAVADANAVGADVVDSAAEDAAADADEASPAVTSYLIRIEINYITFPEGSGEYIITGTYTNRAGVVMPLEDSKTINVVAASWVDEMTLWLQEQPFVQWWNSHLFLKIFLNPMMIVAAVPYLFVGWLRSLGLVLIGFPLAIPIGLGISFMRMARFRVVRFFSAIYVNVIRGTPLFLQIYIAFFGLPLMGISLDSYLLGIIVLAFNSSAYLAEIFRAGIQSIPKGQFEASYSLGMHPLQTMFNVILPQTIRRVIPTATSEFILLYKDTSLLAAVGVLEQMMYAKSIVAGSGNMTPYLVSAGYYLLVTLPLIKVIADFEKKLADAESGSEVPTKRKRKLFGMASGDLIAIGRGSSSGSIPAESPAESSAGSPAESPTSREDSEAEPAQPKAQKDTR